MLIRRWALVIAAVSSIPLAAVWLVRGPIASQETMAPFNTLDSPSGAAIKGYDTVAYFVDGMPRQGSPQFSTDYQGYRWQFASAENKALFEKDPEKYLPAFGGYCAYGVAQGYLVKIEPDAWSIRDGTLYLNYDTGVRKQWEEDWKGFVAEANKKWPQLVRNN